MARGRSQPSNPQEIPMRLPVALAALGALCALPAAPALAHVTLDPPAAPAGSYVRAALRVPHGCAGAATTGISVELPEGVYSAKPMPKPGWRLAIERRRLPQAVRSPHGRDLEEEISRISWEGGPLPDEHYEEFILMLQVPNEPGGTLVLPVLQSCEGGRSDHWAERPAAGQSAHDLARPAPALRLTPR
jgi:uncharacterized protein YcnI